MVDMNQPITNKFKQPPKTKTFTLGGNTYQAIKTEKKTILLRLNPGEKPTIIKPMPRMERPPMFRTFEGTSFRHTSNHKTRTQAITIADRMRKQGYLVRVVPDKSKDKYKWSLYYKKKRR